MGTGKYLWQSTLGITQCSISGLYAAGRPGLKCSCDPGQVSSQAISLTIKTMLSPSKRTTRHTEYSVHLCCWTNGPALMQMWIPAGAQEGSSAELTHSHLPPRPTQGLTLYLRLVMNLLLVVILLSYFLRVKITGVYHYACLCCLRNFSHLQ